MKYRKKPVVIDAIKFDGENHGDVIAWAHAGFPPEANAIITCAGNGLQIRTLEGPLHASVGDWIIKGVKDEFYPCKSDIFEATYEPVTTEKENQHKEINRKNRRVEQLMHARTPWILGVGSDDYPIITDADGNMIATVPMGFSAMSGNWSEYGGKDDTSDFRFIVKAVNEYEDLAAAKALATAAVGANLDIKWRYSELLGIIRRLYPNVKCASGCKGYGKSLEKCDCGVMKAVEDACDVVNSPAEVKR